MMSLEGRAMASFGKLIGYLHKKIGTPQPMSVSHGWHTPMCLDCCYGNI